MMITELLKALKIIKALKRLCYALKVGERCYQIWKDLILSPRISNKTYLWLAMYEYYNKHLVNTRLNI